MPRTFNTTAVCVPEIHYMVNIDQRLQEISRLVDGGKYFAINRARQYGKTTTLQVLGKYLAKVYIVFSLDFLKLHLLLVLEFYLFEFPFLLL